MKRARVGHDRSLPRSGWSSEEWCQYFRRQEYSLLVIPWQLGSSLTPDEKRLVGPSLQEFQQGEGLEGGHFFGTVRAYGEASGDPCYVEAHRLFMAEEQRHARELARFLTLAGIPLLERCSRLNRLFCWIGGRGGLEWTLAIIVMVEVIAQTYYRGLRSATGSIALRRLCDQILRDEKMHVRFHCERLALLRRHRSGWRLWLTHGLDFLFFLGAGLACWYGHHRLLRAAGIGLARFRRCAWSRLRIAWHQKHPATHPQGAEAVPNVVRALQGESRDRPVDSACDAHRPEVERVAQNGARPAAFRPVAQSVLPQGRAR